MGFRLSLSREEKAILQLFIVSDLPSDSDSDEQLSYPQRSLKRLKRISVSLYTAMRFLLSTSNMFERLFSAIGHILNDRRRSLTLANLESLIFSPHNDFWSVRDVNKITSQ